MNTTTSVSPNESAASNNGSEPRNSQQSERPQRPESGPQAPEKPQENTPSRVSRSIGLWLGGIIVAAHASFLGGYSTAVLTTFLPSANEIACRIKEMSHIKEINSPSASGSGFTVLISMLDFDNDGRHTSHVACAFQHQQGVTTMRTCRVLRLEPSGDRAQAMLQAHQTGRQWLEAYNANLLVSDEMAKNNDVVWLWFVDRDPAGNISGDHYVVDHVALARDFNDDFITQLVAVALSSAKPAIEQKEKDWIDVLIRAATRLQKILDHPPTYLTPSQMTAARLAFGVAARAIGKQPGHSEWLERAVAALQAALLDYTRERAPLEWAMAQVNLGSALTTLGERESGTARLEEAVQASYCYPHFI